MVKYEVVYMKLIEVTKEVVVGRNNPTLVKTFLNIDNIIYFYKNDAGSIIQTVDGDRMWVAEAPERIKKRIEDGT